MKPSLALVLGIAFVPAALGCGEEQAEGEGAQYPSAPLGYDMPQETAARAAADTSAQASANIPASPPPPPAPPGDAPGAVAEDPGVPVGVDPNEYADSDPSALSDFRPALDPY